MRTSEQISSEILDKYGLTIDLVIPIEDAVKQAQRDAIDETVKACAESVRLKTEDNIIYIDLISILEVAEKLKQNIK